MTDPASSDHSTFTLRWAVWLLLAQGAALAALTVFLVYLDLTADSTAAQTALAVTGYIALMTVLYLTVGLALARRQRWARGPAIVLQMLQVPIGYTMLTKGLPQVGAPLLVLGLAGAALLLAPSTRRALGLR